MECTLVWKNWPFCPRNLQLNPAFPPDRIFVCVWVSLYWEKHWTGMTESKQCIVKEKHRLEMAKEPNLTTYLYWWFLQIPASKSSYFYSLLESLASPASSGCIQSWKYWWVWTFLRVPVLLQKLAKVLSAHVWLLVCKACAGLVRWLQLNNCVSPVGEKCVQLGFGPACGWSCLVSTLSVMSCSQVSLCLPTLQCDKVYIKALFFSSIFLFFSAAGLAAWEEYPSLKMLMEMVMTKLVWLNPYIYQKDHWKHTFLN